MKSQRATRQSRHWVVGAVAIFGVGQFGAAHHLTVRLADSPAGLSDAARLLVLSLVALMVVGELYAAVSSTHSG